MDIKFAILGFLSWKPVTGYELKRLITQSTGFEWSGNNNQIYTSLVQLHRDNLVTSESQSQERYPTRKIYSLTDSGRYALKEWVLGNSEPPIFRKSFLIQLAWSDQLSKDEMDDILKRYELELETQILMLREQIRRGGINPARTARERYLWEKISENYVRSYELELQWTKEIYKEVDQ
jgi:PadR family transcriptional regulator, regulatory protein AphA